MDQVQATRKRRPSVPVAVYGTKGCADTQKVRRYLDRLDIFYDYLNIDEDLSAARQLHWWTGGTLSHPTVQIGGRILVEPGLEEVEATLAGFDII
jgi:mycoredoxin